ncbi:hypothetical protein MTO96_042191, partial [Rhipicephalus appendiculatus]
MNFRCPACPGDTRRALSTGGVPPFCSGKMPSLGALGPLGPTVLQINAFELYMFHFAYYVVNPSQPGFQNQFQQPVVLDIMGREGTILHCLYLALLQDYLHYYLPHDRDYAPELRGCHPHHQVPSFGGSMPPSPLYRERDSVFWNGMSSPGGICPNSAVAGVLHRHNEPCLIRKDILQSICSGVRQHEQLHCVHSAAALWHNRGVSATFLGFLFLRHRRCRWSVSAILTHASRRPSWRSCSSPGWAAAGGRRRVRQGLQRVPLRRTGVR